MPKLVARNDYAANGGDVVTEAGETFTRPGNTPRRTPIAAR